uniref:Putative 7.8 kDa basic salivary peptide n=1 Tax=Culex quinquefasciatus TaxID=7176 RepID=Q6TS28_CULQU|nr:putative 7.8 kDa basic salivary peptide [Culex quinquefasciatus]
MRFLTLSVVVILALVAIGGASADSPTNPFSCSGSARSFLHRKDRSSWQIGSNRSSKDGCLRMCAKPAIRNFIIRRTRVLSTRDDLIFENV